MGITKQDQLAEMEKHLDLGPLETIEQRRARKAKQLRERMTAEEQSDANRLLPMKDVLYQILRNQTHFMQALKDIQRGSFIESEMMRVYAATEPLLDQLNDPETELV